MEIKHELTTDELMRVGNGVALWGVVFTGGGEAWFVPFPDSNYEEIGASARKMYRLDPSGWDRLLYQSDVVETTKMPEKAIVRKSQRNIDSQMQWAVWERDSYRCRYCGNKRPLTVDHVDLWEEGGATVPANLVSACRSCNKERGRTPYPDWISGAKYAGLSQNLDDDAKQANLWVLAQFPHLKTLRTKPRTR